MDRWLIRGIDFEMKSTDSPEAAKINVELHQSLAEASLSVIGMHTDLEKLRFVCHISKADKTDHRMRGPLYSLHHEAMGERMLHFLEEHLLRPGGHGVRGRNGQDLIQVCQDHLPDVPYSLGLTTIHPAEPLLVSNAIPYDS